MRCIMAREEFIDSLRLAFRDLSGWRVSSGQGAQTDAYLAKTLHYADLWLTPKSVEGFDPADFLDWPKHEREKLTKEVESFRAIAEQVPANKPATNAQSKQARKHLERELQIVREQSA